MRFRYILPVALLVAGCELNLPLGQLNYDPEAGTGGSTSKAPPMAALDCDKNGGVTLAELEARFQINGRTVGQDEFGRYDWNGDGAWNVSEFTGYLHQATMRSWTLSSPDCP